MDVYLVDGTYELFRHFFAVPAAKDANGQEIGAVRGVLTSVVSMLERGATHIGVATDHVVESFRNDLYPGYKTAEGVPPELLSQFPILEEALEAMGVLVWPMVYYEADDALASAAAKAAQDDACQSSLHLHAGQRSWSVRRRHASRTTGSQAEHRARRSRRRHKIWSEAAIDPGLPGRSRRQRRRLSRRGWLGSQSGGAGVISVLPPGSRSERLATVACIDPQSPPACLNRLFSAWNDALLFRTLATLELDVPVFDTVEDLRWKGPRASFAEYCQRIKAPDLLRRVTATPFSTV